MEQCSARRCSCCNLRVVLRSQLEETVDLSKISTSKSQQQMLYLLAANASMRGGTFFPGRRYPGDFCGASGVAPAYCMAGSCSGRYSDWYAASGPRLRGFELGALYSCSGDSALLLDRCIGLSEIKDLLDRGLQMWSARLIKSISWAHVEHFIVGKRLSGLIPDAILGNSVH